MSDIIHHETATPTVTFTDEQRQLISQTVAPDLDPGNELDLFLYQAARTGLDPLTRQIYAIKSYQRKKDAGGRWVSVPRISISATIDGFRLIAERTGRYAGQIGPHWCGSDGVWRDVWTDKAPPVGARVGILRSDFKEPLFQVAHFSEYAQTNKDGALVGTWRDKALHMLAKCAESLALRRAFPQELSGLYTPEEMQASESAVDGRSPEPHPEPRHPVHARENASQTRQEPAPPPFPYADRVQQVVELMHEALPTEYSAVAQAGSKEFEEWPEPHRAVGLDALLAAFDELKERTGRARKLVGDAERGWEAGEDIEEHRQAVRQTADQWPAHWGSWLVDGFENRMRDLAEQRRDAPEPEPEEAELA